MLQNFALTEIKKQA